MQNGHLLSIYPSLIRKIDSDFYKRERIETPDDDFLDLDWATIGTNRLAIISHGLEGDSHRPYVLGMVMELLRKGWDALAWNFRSCSGEINRQLRFYHSGSIEDLELVINHVLRYCSYSEIALIGFSMGGNLTLVYLGKNYNKISKKISKAVVFSVPCNLKSSAIELAKRKNILYMRRFLNLLHEKIVTKMEIMPDKINDLDYHLIKNFRHYDDRYTAPIHGFQDAEDYWKKCSSGQFIPNICIPTLLVNALNDPFLGDECYPYEEASKSQYVFLETPKTGGHVGFINFNRQNRYWSEKRAVEFLGENCV
jgi:predicted alpha/beta-fold hydrolase